MAVAAVGERPRPAQVIAAIRSHRLEVAVAGRRRSQRRPCTSTCRPDPDERVEHVELVQRRIAGDRDRIVEREPPDEHRQPVEHDLFDVRRAARTTSPTSPTASVDVRHRCAIHPTAAADVPPAAPARPTRPASAPVPRPARSPTASRPTVDRSRAPPPGRRRRCWPVRPRRSVVRRTAPPHPRPPRRRSSLVHRQRSERHDVLAAQHQRLTTRRHDPQRRAGLQQPIDQPGRRSHHVLTVVEHHHGRSRLEVLDQAVLDRSTRSRLQPEQGCDLLDNRAVGLRQAEIDEPHTIRRRRTARGGRLRSPVGSCPSRRLRPRSPVAASSSDPTARRARRSDRRSSPAESGGCRWSTVDVRNGGNSRPPTCHSRITRSTPARRCSPRSVTVQLVSDQPRRHIRQHDLPAVARRHDPRRPVQGPPEVVAVTFFGRAGVKSHPHRQPHPILRVDRRPQRRRRVGERRREPITTSREHHPTIGLDRRPQQHIVLRQRLAHPVRIELPPHRRTLDVGEQERHGPRRQRHHHRAEYDTTNTRASSLRQPGYRCTRASHPASPGRFPRRRQPSDVRFPAIPDAVARDYRARISDCEQAVDKGRGRGSCASCPWARSDLATVGSGVEPVNAGVREWLAAPVTHVSAGRPVGAGWADGTMPA